MSDPDKSDSKLPKHVRLNAGLHAIDQTTQQASGDVAEQIGMLFMAHALATRRLLALHNITDRGRRLKLIRSAVAEFDSKLRRFARLEMEPEDSPAVNPSQNSDGTA